VSGTITLAAAILASAVEGSCSLSMTTTLTATAALATGLATASDSLLSGGCGGVCGVSVGGVAAAFRRLGVFVVVVVAGYFVWFRFSKGSDR